MFPLALVVLRETVKESRVIACSFHSPIHLFQEIHSENVPLVEQTHPEDEIICFCCLIWTQADQTTLDICGVDERRIHCLSQRLEHEVSNGGQGPSFNHKGPDWCIAVCSKLLQVYDRWLAQQNHNRSCLLTPAWLQTVAQTESKRLITDCEVHIKVASDRFRSRSGWETNTYNRTSEDTQSWSCVFNFQSPTVRRYALWLQIPK